MKVSELVGKKVLITLYNGDIYECVVDTAFVVAYQNNNVILKNKNGQLYSIVNFPNFIIKNVPNELSWNANTWSSENRIEIDFYKYQRKPFYQQKKIGEVLSIEFSKEDFAEYFAAKEAEEKEREKGLWFESKMRGFTVDFYKPLKEMQEELKSYYLAAVKDIIEKDKLMISNDTIKDAIKNGLVIKYPELKKVLVGDKKDKIEVEAPVLKNDAEIKKVLKKAGLEKRNYDNFDIAIPLQVFVYEYNEDVDYIHKLKKLLKDVEFKPSPLFKYSEEEFEGDSNMEEVYEALKDYYIKK